MADPERREAEETAAGEDEDTGASVAPLVRLEEVPVTTGEEDEDAILDLKSKLYRFDREGNQWKERGTGTVKILKHKESGKVRLLMRQSHTLRICANHYILPTMSVQDHAGNEKSCVWHAADFADGELEDELFCIRFGSIENCKTFKEMFQEAAESQLKKEDNKDASAAADLLKNLRVEDKKPEDKASEEVPSTSNVGSESGGGEPVNADAEDKASEEVPVASNAGSESEGGEPVNAADAEHKASEEVPSTSNADKKSEGGEPEKADAENRDGKTVSST